MIVDWWCYLVSFFALLSSIGVSSLSISKTVASLMSVAEFPAVVINLSTLVRLINIEEKVKRRKEEREISSS